MSRSHETDYFGWVQDQVEALRRRSVNEVDWDNLLEEVTDLGRSVRDELHNRLIVLLAHLLKWQVQPARRSRSWMLTIREQRRRIQRLLKHNASLAPLIGGAMDEAYGSAVDLAADECGLLDDAFPPVSPFTFDQAMTEQVEWEAA